jgi:GNAT superfamily N-acetyltransferase
VKFTVREMTERDIPNASRILSAAYGFLAENGEFSDEECRALVERRGSEDALRKQAAEYTFYIAELEGEPAGIMALRKSEITKLFVHPRFHRRGVGTLLFEVAQRWAVRGGYDRLTTGTTGFGTPFYEAMGMRVCGRKTADRGPLAGHEITLLEKSMDQDRTTRKIKRNWMEEGRGGPGE